MLNSTPADLSLVPRQTADLIYGSENLKALSITKDISGTGDITFTFAFSEPTNNWPPGDDKVVATISDGNTKSVTFQVRESWML